VLIERHYGGVARFFRAKVGDLAAADLVQRTFLACCEGIARYRGDASFRSYLYSIAYRLMCKHYADQRRSFLDLSCADHPAEDPLDALQARHDQDLVMGALQQLPAECRQPLELHYWEQMTAAEAALTLGIPEGTAKTRIRRGRLLLEQRFRAKL